MQQYKQNTASFKTNNKSAECRRNQNVVRELTVEEKISKEQMNRDFKHNEDATLGRANERVQAKASCLMLCSYL